MADAGPKIVPHFPGHCNCCNQSVPFLGVFLTGAEKRVFLEAGDSKANTMRSAAIQPCRGLCSSSWPLATKFLTAASLNLEGRHPLEMPMWVAGPLIHVTTWIASPHGEQAFFSTFTEKSQRHRGESQAPWCQEQEMKFCLGPFGWAC